MGIAFIAAMALLLPVLAVPVFAEEICVDPNCGEYCCCITNETATGANSWIDGTGTRILPKGNWFMYNYYNGSRSTYPLQAGNPVGGQCLVGIFTVVSLGGNMYRIDYNMAQGIEMNGEVYNVSIIDEHLGISNTMNFTGAPGIDDNKDFGVPFYDADGAFYIFAHFGLALEWAWWL
ncbi:hypothetical protein SAMN02745691_01410 [Parasporobacterium paucivorans DSM 15970]|uniref:Uncharacterized protein n=1 Tax=Parasporobacterium paucivorans DSM 15970 TaxID=1122934 RepID=A0A1M6GWB7_9FIRM|nr:hypothetical protein SAMN02745691_01410 [Parasporobacterium paucivorans DSM 15970]